MAFNDITLGLGTTVEYCTTSGGSYTAVGQLKSVDGLASEVGMFDSTGVNSSVGEQVPTIFRAGDFGFKVNLDLSNATHAALYGYHKAKTLLYWKVTFPAPISPDASGSSKVVSFAGWIKSFSTSGHDAESGAEGSFTVAPTGDVTLT